MKIEPLTKELYNKCVENKVEKFILKFSGGNDEGYLDIEMETENYDENYPHELQAQIEEWAWEVYGYNGAGDGSEYGDNITYDIKNKKTSHEEWYTRHEIYENEGEEDSLQIKE